MYRSISATFFGILAVFVLFSPTFASAQSLSMTSPTTALNVQEGDDFASIELGNPWDFDERRDIGWEENFSGSSVGASDGVWSGTFESAGAYVFPLFGGFFGALHADPVPGDKELPKLGAVHGIDASKYSLLSYGLSQTSRSSFAIYWNNDTSVSLWPDGSNYGSNYDGFYNGANAHLHSGWFIYSHDLSNLSSAFPYSSGSWSGTVAALRIDPSISGSAGANTQLGWIRLVDPSSAPVVSISWASSRLASDAVVTIYRDNNNSGFNGTPIAVFSGGSNPGTYSLKSAMLPPGDHYFYVTSRTGASLRQEARSGYSARLRINKAPAATFSAPTQTSGSDYATTVLGNPWDFSDSVDVANLSENSTLPDEWRQFSSPSFSGGMFQAIADPAIAPATETDVQVHLNISNDNPIETGQYRYLTYRIAADGTNYPTISDKVELGFVTRPVYWNYSLFGDGGYPKAHVLYEGFHTYTVDLWDSSIVESGRAWTANSQIRSLRIDPLETNLSTWFWMDWVTLTAEPTDSSGSYTISFSIEDSDSSSFSGSLYYDSDDSGFDGTKIADLTSLSTGDNSYTWNTSGVSNGRYYIYLSLSDGTNTRRFYAPAPMVVGDYVAAPRSASPKSDYDGDGCSDEAIYRYGGGVGTFYVSSSIQDVGTMAFQFGNNDTPIEGDFDGDGKADYAVVQVFGDYLLWFIRRSSDSQLYNPLWGLATDEIVVADYNGDGKDDVAVYRAGVWYILYDDGTSAVYYWGLWGDVPVPADYDGDGQDDIAIWRPATGNWWVLNSGYGTNDIPYYSVEQWGLYGDIPVQGDWDGDGLSDRAVWRPSTGTWYLRYLESDSYEALQWGLPGDVPRVGDFNGDGTLDLTVFRAGVAYWFENFRDGNSAAVQWGLGTDSIPRESGD